DALLGALSLRDIGYHFPNSDPRFHNIDSTQLLALTIAQVQDKGWKLGNADCTIVAEAPKINPFVPQMQSVISTICQVQVEDISIKATTNEKMGFIGREEGIAAFAVALLLRK
ncbi:MAG: 2-C-methyl-D-erythritol 2,4-cyclodiphosphate synthase, partial [Bacteroidia bacterium]|nr:2-C-methyl-D-erythritol 2,4-cyclodiphosphate synthase [Bacteroidia bacterium]